MTRLELATLNTTGRMCYVVVSSTPWNGIYTIYTVGFLVLSLVPTILSRAAANVTISRGNLERHLARDGFSSNANLLLIGGRIADYSRATGQYIPAEGVEVGAGVVSTARAAARSPSAT